MLESIYDPAPPLLSALEEFKNDERNLILHNDNDFIISKSDLMTLKETLGQHFILNHDGGHLSNIWSTPIIEKHNGFYPHF